MESVNAMNVFYQYPGLKLDPQDCMWQMLDVASLEASGILLNEADCKLCKTILRNGDCPSTPNFDRALDGICAGCKQKHGDCVSGVLVLGGLFLNAHRYELLSCVFTEAKYENSSCPMKRILAIEENDGKIWVATTDISLTNNMGRALCQAYQGGLEYFYNSEKNCLRVEWNH